MNVELTAADLAFRDEVRAFIAAHLTDEMRAGQRITTSMYPEPVTSGPWQKALQKRGWLVPLWPKEWGGTGWLPLHRFIFETECALAGAPLVHPMGVRLVGPVILRFGTDAQKREFLPRILASTDYWCQGFSEPNAGSDLASLKLKATPDGDDYLLEGSKIWTTHAHHANWMFALVRTSNEGKRQQGISFLLVDMTSPGITVRPIHTIGGDHDVNEVHFESVRVPRANLVGEENAGWECAKYLLELERGAGIFSPRLRSQLKRVAEAMISAEGGAQHREGLTRRFGDLVSDLDTFEWLELRTMVGVKQGETPGPVSSILKLRSSRLKQAIGELGVDALGAASLRWRGHAAAEGAVHAATEERLEHLLLPEYCNSRAFTIFGGAAEIQLGLIAKTVVGV
ncbi:MAG: acyl-CoA dehydrogenase family protein [Polaromonas sp.]|nr:acyl-CoA dehydrogenase family protein [Polaromonas sp.]